MTQNELDLFKQVNQWVDEDPFIRSWRGEYHWDEYGWQGPEKVYRFWCYDSDIGDGFFVTTENSRFYTKEEMRIRNQELLKELEEG